MKTIAVLDRKGNQVSLTINLPASSLAYTAKTKNSKTGNIPTQWIGATLQESEETCAMCPLMQDRTCYSQQGTPKIGHNQLLKAKAKGSNRSLDAAMTGKDASARYMRMAAIGDPGSIAPEVYKEHDAKVRSNGLGVLAYTHQWYLGHAAFLKGMALASADTWTDVLDAKAAGWNRTCLHVPNEHAFQDGKTIAEKPQGDLDGIRYFLCPAQRDTKVTCNDCGLCDATKKSNVDCIVFVEHGVAMKRHNKVKGA